MVCEASQCVASCQAGLIECDNQCIDPNTSREFCGAQGGCLGDNDGRVCSDGFDCFDGECLPTCAAGLVQCGNDCIDPMTDTSHCGASGDCLASNSGASCSFGFSPVCIAGLCCQVHEDNCMGACADLDTDEDHCGICGQPCDPGEVCWGGMCYPESCAGVLAGDANATSGPYTINPDGLGTFEVHCEMNLYSGGWTLLAIITNGDGVPNWSATSAAWVDHNAFGDATTPATNADAKSPAFFRSQFDEVMIVEAPSTVEVVTSTGCLAGNTLSYVFNRDSKSTFDCAWECSTVLRDGAWNGQSVQTNGLRFRCSDDDGDIDANGHAISLDDNSFLTTLNNLSHDFSFGFGAGQASDQYADFDATTSAGGDTSDTAARLVYGR
jgi:hypothetical protein